MVGSNPNEGASWSPFVRIECVHHFFVRPFTMSPVDTLLMCGSCGMALHNDRDASIIWTRIDKQTDSLPDLHGHLACDCIF
jgi:hypothetical protein